MNGAGCTRIVNDHAVLPNPPTAEAPRSTIYNYNTQYLRHSTYIPSLGDGLQLAQFAQQTCIQSLNYTLQTQQVHQLVKRKGHNDKHSIQRQYCIQWN